MTEPEVIKALKDAGYSDPKIVHKPFNLEVRVTEIIEDTEYLDFKRHRFWNVLEKLGVLWGGGGEYFHQIKL